MKINIHMQKANMLAKQILAFILYIDKNYENSMKINLNTDKLYQVKLLIDEFRFRIIAEELLRINQFSWDEKYTLYLVNEFQKGIRIIEEYVRRNEEELFLLQARIYTLNSLIRLLTEKIS